MSGGPLSAAVEVTVGIRPQQRVPGIEGVVGVGIQKMHHCHVVRLPVSSLVRQNSDETVEFLPKQVLISNIYPQRIIKIEPNSSIRSQTDQ